MTELFSYIDASTIFIVKAAFISATSDFLLSSSKGSTDRMLRSALLALCVLSAACYCTGLAPAVAVQYKPTPAPVQKVTAKAPVAIKAPATTKAAAQTQCTPFKAVPTPFADTNSDEYDPVEAKKIYPRKAYVEFFLENYAVTLFCTHAMNEKKNNYRMC